MLNTYFDLSLVIFFATNRRMVSFPVKPLKTCFAENGGVCK